MILEISEVSLIVRSRCVLQEAVPVTGRCLLREWLPWQNRLQQTYKIDHSTKTKHFVEMMEFIEIQRKCNSLDLNHC